MKKEFSRYSSKRYLSQGLPLPLSASNPSTLTPVGSEDMPLIAAGGFDNIMKVIFENEDGAIPNLLTVRVNENTPDSVREFINNVLSANITAFKSAPDDDTAFDLICPRGCSLEHYSSYLRDSISRYKREYESKTSKSD